jgi:murein DD-endopeptidase MepM/ murein hydrolase activator NlpD
MRTGASSPFATVALAAVVTLSATTAGGSAQQPRSLPASRRAAREARFEFPCDGYLRGLRGEGNFGVLITRKDSPFTGSHHLAEDLWLPAGTEVRSVAAGIVRYSDFSPSWTDQRGRVHWNLGNVIVIEHPLEPAADGLAAVCSLYAHLGSDRRVAAGDRVERGQAIGSIGKDRSEENGLYPVHLHFGLHRGPYYQIPPAWRRGLEEAARTTGIVVGTEPPVRGEIEFRRISETSVLVRAKQDRASVVLSLLVGSTAPGRKPADIMAWCSGYGDRETVDEWLCPSRWIAARAGDEKSDTGTKRR